MLTNLNDGSQRPPRLRIDLSYMNLADLPEWSTGPRGSDEEKLAAIKEAGFEGVQGADAALALKAGLIPTAMGHFQTPGELAPAAKIFRDQGYECLTIHLGSGLNSESDADALFEDVLSTAAELDYPIYVETHRATLTQDMWRTVELTKRFPQIRFNADYSHWYTGQEMWYGDWDYKMKFLQPVFDRISFMHGRMGNCGHVQMDIGDGTNRLHVDHFRDMWTRTYAAFLKNAKPGDYMPFCPELLSPKICYAREFIGPNGVLREESDRWEQAKVLVRIAKECWAQAETSLKSS